MGQNYKPLCNESIVNAALCERRHNTKNRKARPFRRTGLLQSALLLATIFLSLQIVHAYAEDVDLCSSGGCLAAATKAAPAPKKNKGKQAAKSNKPVAPKTSPAKQAFKPPAKGTTSGSSTLKTRTAKVDSKVKDDLMQQEPEEQELLSVYGKRFATQEKEAGNVWIRLLGSILAVLVLFMGFVRWMLPELITRYPEFFEYLKRHSEQAAQVRDKKNKQMTNSHNSDITLSIAQDMRADAGTSARKPTDESQPPNRSIYNYGSIPTHANLPARQVSSEVRVLGSAMLGEQQGLFLVDIPGHRLLLSSTSNGIEVLKEFKDTDEWRSRLMHRRHHNRYPYQSESAESLENWENVPGPSLLRSGLRSDNLAFTGTMPARRSSRNYVQKPDALESQTPDVQILADYDDTF